jgi:hypothetical protein
VRLARPGRLFARQSHTVTSGVTEMVDSVSILDRIACRVGIWALVRLFGECDTDVRDDFPGYTCLGCDATRVIKSMREVLEDEL